MAKLKITIIEEKAEHFFYYPDKSCKTDDGGIKMLLSYLRNKENINKLKVKLSLIF